MSSRNLIGFDQNSTHQAVKLAQLIPPSFVCVGRRKVESRQYRFSREN